MNSRMFILFNHSLTEAQREDAEKKLGVTTFIVPPPELSAAWSQLPPERTFPLTAPSQSKSTSL